LYLQSFHLVFQHDMERVCHLCDDVSGVNLLKPQIKRALGWCVVNTVLLEQSRNHCELADNTKYLETHKTFVWQPYNTLMSEKLSYLIINIFYEFYCTKIKYPNNEILWQVHNLEMWYILETTLIFQVCK